MRRRIRQRNSVFPEFHCWWVLCFPTEGHPGLRCDPLWWVIEISNSCKHFQLVGRRTDIYFPFLASTTQISMLNTVESRCSYLFKQVFIVQGHLTGQGSCYKTMSCGRPLDYYVCYSKVFLVYFKPVIYVILVRGNGKDPHQDQLLVQVPYATVIILPVRKDLFYYICTSA